MILLLPSVVYAGGGPLGIDSEHSLDTGGIWARKYQTGIENGVIAVELAGATRNAPLSVQILPGGVTIGISKRF